MMYSTYHLLHLSGESSVEEPGGGLCVVRHHGRGSYLSPGVPACDHHLVLAN